MQKIYLLLRDNKQSGPHSLDELLSMNMKNTDLVWVEGRSMGWAFPSEIESLRPFLPEAEIRSVPVETIPENKITAGSKIDVSHPKSSPTEMRKKEVRVKAEDMPGLAFEKDKEGGQLNRKYFKSLDEVENDYTLWMIQNRKKKKRFSGRKIAFAGILLIGSVGGWLLADMTFSKSRINEIKINTVENMIPDEMTTSAAFENVVAMNNDHPEKKNLASFQNPPNQTSKEKKKQGSPDHFVPVSAQENEPDVMDADAQESATPVHSEATTLEEKKSSLKEKIGNWLKGGRELNKPATKEEKSLVDISGQVEVKVIKDPSDWMMGINGQKIIVHNRSDNSLNKAIVELLYYSEEKTLLDKKQVEVSGLTKGKSKTFNIPDHKMADHVEAIVAKAQGE